MSVKLKGTICGIIAAVSYGMNPLGALFLYQQGVNTNSVLFYRFFLAAIILGAVLLAYRKSFAVSLRELSFVVILGVLFAVSSLTLFGSFHYIDAGIACTILFIYPAMVAVIMALFFKEKLSAVTVLSVLFALAGIALLYKGDGGKALSTIGVLMVLLSALTYALYIIVVNKSALTMPAMKLTFYVLLICTLFITIHSFFSETSHLQLLTTPSAWMLVLMLALVPTVISLVTMVLAVHSIGSTPTAVMGALEPITAVIIGVAVFGEAFSMRLAVGILMVVAAVTLIVAGSSLAADKAD